MSPPLDHLRPRRRRRSWAVDVAVAVLVALLSLGPLLARSNEASPAARVALLVAVSVPLVVRRVHPEAVFAWVILVLVVAAFANEHLTAPEAGVVALYTVAANRPRRTGLLAAAAAEAAILVGALVVPGARYVPVVIPLTAVTAAALGLGLYTGTRRALVAELRHRAERLERERDQQGELAAATERARIAREMHDVVAHHLTVMVALSDGAVAASGTDPTRAAGAMRAVSATGRQALTDTRRLLGVLREPAGTAGERAADAAEGTGAGDGRAGSGRADPAVRQPLPGLAELDELLDGVRAAGLPVRFDIVGAADDLPSAVQATLYRLVQEALTNTLKHGGPGARAHVRLEHRGDEVALDVVDDGAGGAAPVPAGVGRGLTGMRERVHAFGGEVRTGPRASGGWQVSARLQAGGGGAP